MLNSGLSKVGSFLPVLKREDTSYTKEGHASTRTRNAGATVGVGNVLVKEMERQPALCDAALCEALVRGKPRAAVLAIVAI